MAALTPKQIAKLTPEQRKKREERLAYNRRYVAAKKAKESGKREYRVGYRATKKAQNNAIDTVIDRLSVLFAELNMAKATQQKIVEEIASLTK